MLSHSPVIIQDARPEIGDTPLMLICRMGQRACRLPFYIQSQPITPFWIDVTMEPFDCRKDQTNISEKHFRPGGMAPSEWTSSVRAVRDTPVAVYSAPGVNTTRRIAYRPPIAVSSRSVGLLF